MPLVKPELWIAFLVATMIVFGLIIFGIQIKNFAEKNPGYFKLTPTEQAIFDVQHFVKKHQRYDSRELVPFIPLLIPFVPLWKLLMPVFGIFMLFETSQTDMGGAFPILAFFLVFFNLMIYLFPGGIFVKDEFLVYENYPKTKKFYFENIQEITFWYSRRGRYVEFFDLRISTKNDHFERLVGVTSGKHLVLSIIDAGFRKNPNLVVAFRGRDGLHDPEIELLIQARKPIGIFGNDF